MSDAERSRMQDAEPWRRWGPYVAERAWGSVREDYSAGGDAWAYLPHDAARSTAFRWSEEGLAAICDEQQRLCLAWSFWNGVDPVLKERAFGLSNGEGNHGEDAKEEWWYVDATPSSSYLRWAYRYPSRAYPYDELRRVNAERGRDDPEFELADTGALAGCWELAVEIAKDGPESMVARLTAINTGGAEAQLHVLPTLWFRNTWTWDPDRPAPEMRLAGDGAVRATHPTLGEMVLRRLDGAAEPLFCENETNTRLRYGTADGPAYPKDGIGDHVVTGTATVNPAGVGTKAALHTVLSVPAGGTATLTVQLSRPEAAHPDPGAVLALRRSEADDYYSALLPPALPPERAAVARQALAGMLWGKCFYHYDVQRWLAGDQGQPPPPAERRIGRNSRWQHVDVRDVLSMPDPWEYPWFAAWDLAFHCVVLAHVDPQLAKDQLLTLCREWYMHPDGQLPAYEWDFGDANPPVHAWAALEVFRLTGGDDWGFLERVFHKLLLNVTWWFNREDADGNDLFAGGFLGLDNVGPFDRSHPPPGGGRLEQSDGTAWMAMYCLDLLDMALTLATHDDTYQDVAVTFFEHFTKIAVALESQGLWDEQDGFCYDLLHLPDGRRQPLRVRSVAGLIVLAALRVVDAAALAELPDFAARLHRFLQVRPEYAAVCGACPPDGAPHDHVLSVLSPERLVRVLAAVLDEGEFLSPHGLRSLSKRHAAAPYVVDLGGSPLAPVDYEPGESRSGLFGGNSNWRGPVWFPVNVLILRGLERAAAAHPDLEVELPTGSGRRVPLAVAAAEVGERLIGLFLPVDGRIPAAGERNWPADRLWFHEYFHGDTGEGLGASHQTGWTGLVADLLLRPVRAG